MFLKTPVVIYIIKDVRQGRVDLSNYSHALDVEIGKPMLKSKRMKKRIFNQLKNQLKDDVEDHVK